jgi:hypothetical protein
MSITITNPGVAGITVESDPTALKLTGGTLSGELELPQIGNLLNTPLVINSYNDTGAGTNYNHTFTPFDGKFNLAPNGGGLTFPNGTTQTTAGLPLTGGTTSGKVTFTSTSTTAGVNLGYIATVPTTTIVGDAWIGANNIHFKDSTNTQRNVANVNSGNTFVSPQIIQVPVGSTGTALRVTQLGTGNAFVVEDSTTPDGSAFTIDQHGKVGIGVAPSATACLSLDLNGVSFGNSGAIVQDIDTYFAINPPSGWDANSVSNAIKIRINGQDYYIPYWTA